MIDFCVQLDVRGQSRPQGGAWRRDQTESEFALEHEDCDAEERSVGEESKDKGGRYLVGSVRDAHVEVGQVRFYEIAD